MTIKKQIISCVFLALVLMPVTVLADRETGNRAHVAAGKYGQCFAKSIPRRLHDRADEPRQLGETRIYRVEKDKNVGVGTYNWFSQRLFLVCSNAREGSAGIAVIRLGPWHRGHTPSHDHLALAFYFEGELIKRYSTRDIAGEEKVEGSLSKYKNVSISSSHYSVFSRYPQLVWEESWDTYESGGAYIKKKPVIEALTVDGRRLVFDIATGEIINAEGAE